MNAKSAQQGEPRHGEIMIRTQPATKQRARWCSYCGCWTWEVGYYQSGTFRHGRKLRTEKCRSSSALVLALIRAVPMR